MKEKDKNVNDLYDENLMTFIKKLANTIDSIDLIKDPIKNTTKLPGEIRLIGYDSGASSTTKKVSNDYSVFTFMRLLPNDDGYKREIVHIEPYDGKDVEQMIRIERLFTEFQADKIITEDEDYKKIREIINF